MERFVLFVHVAVPLELFCRLANARLEFFSELPTAQGREEVSEMRRLLDAFGCKGGQ